MSGGTPLPSPPLLPTVAEAIARQRLLAARVCREDRFGDVHTVGGVDVACGPRGAPAQAAVVVLSFPALEEIDRATSILPLSFPYIPGLLSFREAPAAMAAYARLSVVPDLLFVDGHGLAHPRRCGIACHLGVLLDVPAIGVGKSRLIGSYHEPGPLRGDRAPLVDQGEMVGVVLRSRPGARPIFVSVGHRVSLESAAGWVLRCLSRYRLPEPVRLADRLSRQRSA